MISPGKSSKNSFDRINDWRKKIKNVVDQHETFTNIRLIMPLFSWILAVADCDFLSIHPFPAKKRDCPSKHLLCVFRWGNRFKFLC